MKPQQQHRAADPYDLHSLHRNSASKIMKMKPLSALVPTSGAPQPKVYKVEPIHFRELVQKLTGAQQQPPQSQPQPRQQTNLQRVSPPPLPLQPHQLQLQLQSQSDSKFANEKQVPNKVEKVDEQKSYSDNKMQNGVGTELILSPNFQAWFSFAMMSPRPASIAQMEQR